MKKRKTRVALLDGDVLVYTAGFASDASAKKRWIESGGDLNDFNLEVDHEPIEFCLHGTGKLIRSLLEITDADEYAVFLSHPVNYREIFYPPYKTNRDVTHKPFWYDEVKQYLLDKHPTEFSEQGDEADDKLGQESMKLQDEGLVPIIATNDKDLDMIPGWHYNFSKTKKENGLYHMEDPEALQRFYTQILTGDSTDGIPGMFQKLGKKAMARYLYPLEAMDDEQDMRDYVLDIFQGDVEHINLMGKLLWIKRDERWYDERLPAYTT